MKVARSNEPCNTPKGVMNTSNLTYPWSGMARSREEGHAQSIPDRRCASGATKLDTRREMTRQGLAAPMGAAHTVGTVDVGRFFWRTIASQHESMAVGHSVPTHQFEYGRTVALEFALPKAADVFEVF